MEEQKRVELIRDQRVLVERNTEPIRNGKPSRGPNPNGHESEGGNVAGLGNSGGTVIAETISGNDNSVKRNTKSKAKQNEYEEKIRVGRDYQAVCPPLIPEQERKPELLNHRALLVWSPTKEIPDSKLEEYISVAKEKYGYNGEQALGMLFWHKHDLESAVKDLANFTPFPDEWSIEDKVLFEQAFQFHGKSFHRIRQILPDKSIGNLVNYYYTWKKSQNRRSVMDRQEKLKANKEASENGSDNGINEESDNDDKDLVTATNSSSVLYDQTNSKASCSNGIIGGTDSFALTKQNKCLDMTIGYNEISVPSPMNTSAILNAAKRQQTPQAFSTVDLSGGCGTPTNSVSGDGHCTNCGVVGLLLHPSPQEKLCFRCHHHWRRTGNKRPTSEPWPGKQSRENKRHKRKPPRGMHINLDDIMTLASSPENEEKFTASTDREIASLLSQVQLNKKTISALKKENSENMKELRVPENINRINARWTNDEVLLGVECVRNFGKDFQAIAETLNTKTEAHVRTFYLNYRRRHNLDQLVQLYDAEKEAAVAATSSSSTNSISNTAHKNDDTKKEDAVYSTNTGSINESDNPTSWDGNASMSSDSAGATRKDNIIMMEVNLDVEENNAPASKKIALSGANQDYPKPGTI